jgi:hypothetical protein
VESLFHARQHTANKQEQRSTGDWRATVGIIVKCAANKRDYRGVSILSLTAFSAWLPGMAALL